MLLIFAIHRSCWCISIAIDQLLYNFELVSFLLIRLGSDYESFVTFIATRVGPLSLEDLYGDL